MNNRLLTDRRTLFYLFLGFRIMLLLVYQPFLLQGVERGLSTFGDFQTYHQFAQLSDAGKLPYRDFWYEFPPVFPVISLAVYAFAKDFTPYATALGLLMTLFDMGNWWLLGRIGKAVHGEQTGLGLLWIYGLLAAPLVLTWWTFEPMVTFAILLALDQLIVRKENRSALSAAFGALTKLWPLAMVAVVARFYPIKTTIRYGLIAGIITLIGIGAMLGIGGKFGTASLVAQFNKASYSTVWALLDQNYKTGNFGPIQDRFDPAKAYELQGNPAIVPSWLRLIVFGGIGLFVFTTMRRFDARGMVAFTAIMITLFFLWAQGWSPQWMTTLIVLVLLNFPTRVGILISLALSFVSFVEFPVLFMRTAETDGAISGAQLPVFTALILFRTALLIGFALGLYGILRRPVSVQA